MFDDDRLLAWRSASTTTPNWRRRPGATTRCAAAWTRCGPTWRPWAGRLDTAVPAPDETYTDLAGDSDFFGRQPRFDLLAVGHGVHARRLDRHRRNDVGKARGNDRIARFGVTKQERGGEYVARACGIHLDCAPGRDRGRLALCVDRRAVITVGHHEQSGFAGQLGDVGLVTAHVLTAKEDRVATPQEQPAVLPPAMVTSPFVSQRRISPCGAIPSERVGEHRRPNAAAVRARSNRAARPAESAHLAAKPSGVTGVATAVMYCVRPFGAVNIREGRGDGRGFDIDGNASQGRSRQAGRLECRLRRPAPAAQARRATRG